MRSRSSPLERRLRISNAAFAVTFSLLILLAGWWTILIARLVNESYDLKVLLHGATAALVAEHDRKRFMLLGETSMLSILAISLVGMAWRYAQAERRQIRRLEGLLAASTHELKTPVAGVRALLESLESGVLPPERMKPHLGRGLQSLARLEHLIEGILAYQAAIARPTMERSEVGLLSLAREVVEHRLSEAPGEGIQVEGEEVVARVNPEAMRVILENLLDNARKYGGQAPLRVRVGSDAEQVYVEVVDEGQGFAPDEVEGLFEPYERGSAGQRRHGTGLGLYIGRSLARAMGGELEGESPGPGRGATFRVQVRRG